MDLQLIHTVQSVVGVALLASGVLLFVVAAVGMVRFSDAYTRLTAVTKSGTLGLCAVLLGVLVMDPSWGNAVKLLLATMLQLLTTPIGGFALSRGSFRSGAPLPEHLQYDELSDAEDGSLFP